VKPLAAAVAAAALAGGAAHASGGSLIVFAADRAPAITGDVYRADANGHLANLTHSPWQETQPLVSPNGKLVAFLSDRDGGSLWVMGVDDRGLRRLNATGIPSQQYVGMAWSPDNEELALVTGTVNGQELSVAGLGLAPRTLAHSSQMNSPAWSPDGTLITVLGAGEVDAFTAAGKHVWSVPSGGGLVGWSPRGLFATGEYDGRIHVVDEHGVKRFSVAAEATATWSPSGDELASVSGRRLEVHTAAGRLVFHARLPVPHAGIQWSWASPRALVFANPYSNGGFRVDLATGTISPFDIASFGLNTAGSGTNWSVRNGTHVYAHVSGCDDDGGPNAAIASLQRVPHSTSIVYQSYCAEPFDNLYAINGDGTGLRRITNVQANQVVPRISPDRTRIAFGESPATGLSCKGCPESLRTIGVDGSAATTLTSPPDCTFDDSPSWSPDGTQIMFAHSGCDTAPDAMLIGAQGGSPTDLHVPAWTLAWGPTQIAYANGTTVPSSLWTAAPNGAGRVRVGSIGAGLTTPAWSAGGRLAYLLGTSIVVQGKKVPLPFVAVRSVAWSPDGTRFLVAAKAKGTPTFDLYTVRTDGTDVIRLTQNLDASSADWR
jgi:Tol biopolymer transport system component